LETGQGGIPDMKNPILEKFYQEIGHHCDIRYLFDELDEVAFFLKNRQFQIVAANQHLFGRLGFKEECEIVGKDDFELFPKPLARKFRDDDRRVLETGEEMPKMVELFLSRQGLPDWFVTTKMPIRDLIGKPAGIMGTVQRYNQKRGLKSADSAIAKAVGRMLDEPGEINSIFDLAAELGMSHRNFDRRFKEDTGLTPKQFLGRSRVQLGCQMLQQTAASIAEISIDLGYCDQSAFTAQFRQRMGFTPNRYRKTFDDEKRAEAVLPR
jgi:PAS domain S-box-containing protein